MEIRNVEKQNTAAVRIVTSTAELPKTIGEAYGAIMTYLGSLGKNPSGAPFVMYYNMDMDNLDVEVGFPVTESIPGNGRVFSSAIPSGKVASAVHKGAYTTLHITYDALTAFIKERGCTPEPWMYEIYLNSPADTAPDQLLTEIVFPLK